MRTKYILPMLGVFLSVLLVSPSFGQLTFDESNDGELSNSGAAPTALLFGLGANTISGNLGSNGQSGATNGSGTPNPNDADFFTFSLSGGQQVNSIVTTRSGDGFQSFVGFNNAATIQSTTLADLAGGNLFNNDGGLTSTGITAIPSTLSGAGDFTFVFQEVAAGADVDYSVTFNVVSTAAVPEPASATLLSLGLLSVLANRRRR